MKIVINTDYGGFALSKEAFSKFLKLTNNSVDYDWEIERNHPVLVKIIEEMGEKAAARASELKVVEIPDGVLWEIKNYDGQEWIAEKHRTWR